MKGPIRRWAGLCFALLLHVVLATSYAIGTPAFEAPDENGHFYYACFVAQRFPEQPIVIGSHELAHRSIWDESDLGHHPPLYYAVLAAVLHALGSDDILPTVHARGSSEGPFQFDHVFDEARPRSREIGILTVLRVVSVLLGVLSLWMTWLLGRTLWPDRPAIADLATILLATLPQWSATHGALDNGNLATALSHVAYVLLARMLVSRRPGAGSALSLGACCGAGLLSKATCMALGPVVAVTLLWLSWVERPQRRRLLGTLLAVGAIASASFLPQVLRNLALYGEPLAQHVHEAAFAQSRVPKDALSDWLIHGFPSGLFQSFVGYFGWWRLRMPDPVYLTVAIVAVAGLFGSRLLRARSSDLPGRFVLLWSAAISTFLLVLKFNLTFAQPQGRYLFPAAGPMLLLLAAGFIGIKERYRSCRHLPTLLVFAAVIGSGVVYLMLVRPAFALSVAQDADRYAASISGGLRSECPVASREIELLGPADGITISEAPEFTFRSPPGGAPCSVHLWLESGRILGATYEQIALDLSAGRFRLPAEIWDVVPPGVRLHWNVRRVADRSAGEDPRTMPGSPTWAIVRR
ncbi:MAG: DUF2142 domain-containing protein [Planctomycetota bacterium]